MEGDNKPHRKPGPRIKNNTPFGTYDRQRKQYHRLLTNKKITLKEYNKLMDTNLEVYQRDRKQNKSLKKIFKEEEKKNDSSN